MLLCNFIPPSVSSLIRANSSVMTTVQLCCVPVQCTFTAVQLYYSVFVYISNSSAVFMCKVQVCSCTFTTVQLYSVFVYIYNSSAVFCVCVHLQHAVQLYSVFVYISNSSAVFMCKVQLCSRTFTTVQLYSCA